MKKNGFLTFCFAFIPGAGQMYQGYMKRGLSMVAVCAAAVLVGSLLMPLTGFALAVCCIVWMASFFDTFNLRSQLLAGDAPADDFLFHLGQDVSFTRFFQARHKLFGWGLVAVGLYVLYDELVMDLLARLYWQFENSWFLQLLYNINAQCGSPLTDAPKQYDPIPEFAPMDEFKMPEPNVPCTLFETYYPDRPAAKSPMAPVPYDAST